MLSDLAGPTLITVAVLLGADLDNKWRCISCSCFTIKDFCGFPVKSSQWNMKQQLQEMSAVSFKVKVMIYIQCHSPKCSVSLKTYESVKCISFLKITFTNPLFWIFEVQHCLHSCLLVSSLVPPCLCWHIATAISRNVYNITHITAFSCACTQ